ncbi:hypothetical protein ALC57_10149 [Trachymyrmex cornetzi]|uniref:Uncharacterized protein n=1 Tax=Trachymyrmex cornetzi TaxID=471704 RepID=A0A151J4L1_9HYME|nr:hypothetical protein ALC57_10149 [Trachymyrmex cornetzi]
MAEDLRDEEQCTIEVLIVAVDEVESQSRASQQPPTHLLLDFLPTWPIPLESAYLNSRALVKLVDANTVNADIDHVRSMGSCTLSAGRSHPRYRRAARIGISGMHVT